MVKNEDNSYTSIKDAITLSSIQDSSWIHQESPLFLPPSIFSRIDSPVDYKYRSEPKHRDGYNDPNANRPAHLIGVSKYCCTSQENFGCLLYISIKFTLTILRLLLSKA